jgi:hypothetical protein
MTLDLDCSELTHDRLIESFVTRCAYSARFPHSTATRLGPRRAAKRIYRRRRSRWMRSLRARLAFPVGFGASRPNCATCHLDQIVPSDSETMRFIARFLSTYLAHTGCPCLEDPGARSTQNISPQHRVHVGACRVAMRLSLRNRDHMKTSVQSSFPMSRISGMQVIDYALSANWRAHARAPSPAGESPSPSSTLGSAPLSSSRQHISGTSMVQGQVQCSLGHVIQRTARCEIVELSIGSGMESKLFDGSDRSNPNQKENCTRCHFGGCHRLHQSQQVCIQDTTLRH